MTQDTPSFFALDRGTASTSAALIAPVDGRYRMLAAAALPAAIDPEVVLEDLAWRVARTDASISGHLDGWRDWSRLEVGTTRAPTAVLVAASEHTGESLERAFLGAGWIVSARFYGPDPELIAFGEACLEPGVDAVVAGLADDAGDDEREAARLLWPRAGSLTRLRDDLALVACGSFTERPEGIREERLFALPAPEAVPLTSESALRGAAGQVGLHLASGGQPPAADGRAALRASLASLAVLLGERVEGIEIGVSAGSRTLANAGGELRHAIVAAAGLFPRALLEDDEVAERVVSWSTFGGDPAPRIDALRDLVLHPWSGPDRDAAHLRLAALRAALERLGSTWAGEADGHAREEAADVLVLSGGAFSGLPPVASALAVIDGVRRPGAAAMLHDHAGILAPLGALPVEDDRRRLLADLMDDCLLPLGSVLLTGALGDRGRGRGTLGVSTSLGDEVRALEPGQLQLVDLPPGIVARLDIDPVEGAILGVSGRRLTLEVSGGLGGLLVDTRGIPLELPPPGEARRAQLEAWEEPAWQGSDR